MNERLVFFCDRDKRPCHLYRWGATAGGSSYLYQVYCRSALDETPPEQPGQRIDAARLINQVAAAGGGLVAETRQTGDLVVLNLQMVPAEGYTPAHGMVMLAPGQEPKPAPIDGRGITLTAGELALVPATADDEANLGALIEHLQRLPGDYRGLVLDVLRQPGIDGAMRRLTLRISDLLERLGKTPVEGPEASGRGSQRVGALAPGAEITDTRRAEAATPKVRIGGFWPWLFTGLLTLNLAAAGLGTYLIQRPPGAETQLIPCPSEEPTVGESESTNGAVLADSEKPVPPSDCESSATRLGEQEEQIKALKAKLDDCQSKNGQACAVTDSAEDASIDPKKAVNDLIETWMMQAYAWPKDEPRRIVAMGHFSDDQGGAIYVEDWLADHASGTDNPFFRRQERIVYGLAKLILLADGIKINDNKEETLKRFDYRTNVKDAIKTLQEKLQNATDDDERHQLEDDRHLLAWLACDVFPEEVLDGNARFVKVTREYDPDKTDNGKQDKDDRDVDLGISCTEWDRNRVLQAIERHRNALRPSSQ